MSCWVTMYGEKQTAIGSAAYSLLTTWPWILSFKSRFIWIYFSSLLLVSLCTNAVTWIWLVYRKYSIIYQLISERAVKKCHIWPWMHLLILQWIVWKICSDLFLCRSSAVIYISYILICRCAACVSCVHSWVIFSELRLLLVFIVVLYLLLTLCNLLVFRLWILCLLYWVHKYIHCESTSSIVLLIVYVWPQQ